MSEPTTNVYVIYETTEDDEMVLHEAHVSAESATAGLKSIHVGGTLDIVAVELKSVVDYEVLKEKKATKKPTKKAEKSSDDEDLAKSIKETRKTLPDLPGARPATLKGLKLLFSGTMTKDRKTCQAAAILYGAHVISNPKKADYAVLGTKPGAKKLEGIQSANTPTITEEELYEMLRTGVLPAGRQLMAASPMEVSSEQSVIDDSDDYEEDLPPPPLKKKQKQSL